MNTFDILGSFGRPQPSTVGVAGVVLLSVACLSGALSNESALNNPNRLSSDPLVRLQHQTLARNTSAALRTPLFRELSVLLKAEQQAYRFNPVQGVETFQKIFDAGVAIEAFAKKYGEELRRLLPPPPNTTTQVRYSAAELQLMRILEALNLLCGDDTRLAVRDFLIGALETAQNTQP